MKMGGGACVGITVAGMVVGGTNVKTAVGVDVSVGEDVIAGVQAVSAMAKTARKTIQK